jgi:hypothetical protein
VLSTQCEIIVASPLGGEAPLDPSSVEAFENDAISTKFLSHHENLWKNTHKLSEFAGKAKDFDAIFFVGGHGRMLISFLSTTSQIPSQTEKQNHGLLQRTYTDFVISG